MKRNSVLLVALAVGLGSTSGIFAVQKVQNRLVKEFTFALSPQQLARQKQQKLYNNFLQSLVATIAQAKNAAGVNAAVKVFNKSLTVAIQAGTLPKKQYAYDAYDLVKQDNSNLLNLILIPLEEIYSYNNQSLTQVQMNTANQVFAAVLVLLNTNAIKANAQNLITFIYGAGNVLQATDMFNKQAVAIAQRFIAKGADVNGTLSDQKTTPLIAAMEVGSLPLVQLLLKNGALVSGDYLKELLPYRANLMAQLNAYNMLQAAYNVQQK